MPIWQFLDFMRLLHSVFLNFFIMFSPFVLCHVYKDLTTGIRLECFITAVFYIFRVTISCLFLRFVLIFKGNVLENVNVLISKKRAYF